MPIVRNISSWIRTIADLAPATKAVVISPNDSADLEFYSRAIYVGGVGDLTVEMAEQDGTTTLFTAVPAGTLLPIAVRRVMSTGTTATAIVALR